MINKCAKIKLYSNCSEFIMAEDKVDPTVTPGEGEGADAGEDLSVGTVSTPDAPGPKPGLGQKLKQSVKDNFKKIMNPEPKKEDANTKKGESQSADPFVKHMSDLMAKFESIAEGHPYLTMGNMINTLYNKIKGSDEDKPSEEQATKPEEKGVSLTNLSTDEAQPTDSNDDFPTEDEFNSMVGAIRENPMYEGAFPAEDPEIEALGDEIVADAEMLAQDAEFDNILRNLETVDSPENTDAPQQGTAGPAADNAASGVTAGITPASMTNAPKGTTSDAEEELADVAKKAVGLVTGGAGDAIKLAIDGLNKVITELKNFVGGDEEDTAKSEAGNKPTPSSSAKQDSAPNQDEEKSSKKAADLAKTVLNAVAESVPGVGMAVELISKVVGELNKMLVGDDPSKDNDQKDGKKAETQKDSAPAQDDDKDAKVADIVKKGVSALAGGGVEQLVEVAVKAVTEVVKELMGNKVASMEESPNGTTSVKSNDEAKVDASYNAFAAENKSNSIDAPLGSAEENKDRSLHL